MEDTYTHHSTGYIRTVCGGEAVAEIQGRYLCDSHAIDTMTVTSDLREPEPAAEV
jgi:hypothetical protein